MPLTFLRSLSNKIHSGTSQLFVRWGGFVYDHPWWILAFAISVAFLLSSGIAYREVEDDALTLWVPKHATVIDDRKTIKNVFGSQSRLEVMYLVSQTPDKNVLRKDVFEALNEFHTRFQSEVEVKGLAYSDFCYRVSPNSPCRSPNHPLAFLEVRSGIYDLTRVDSDAALQKLVNSGKGQPEYFPEGSEQFISVQYMFGGTQPELVQTQADGSNNIQTAEAITWMYELNSRHSRETTEAYEEALEAFADRFNQENDVVQVYWYTSSSIDRGSYRAIDDDLLLLQIGISGVGLFVILTTGKLHTYSSRILAGLLGLGCVGIAFAEVWGVGGWIGVKGSVVTSMLPFIMLGIGVDDMFVFLNILDQAPSEAGPKQKFQYMVEHAGLTVSLTSFTNAISFAMGSLTSIPAMHDFCVYASLGMLFDYFNKLTVFVALLSFDVRRSAQGKGDCFGLLACAPESRACCYGRYIYDEAGNVRESYKRKFFREVYGPCITSRWGKALVLLLLVGFVGFNVYETATLPYQFDYEDFVDSSFYLHQTIKVRDKYFDQAPRNVRMYTVDCDFTVAENQQRLLELSDALSRCDDCKQSWVIPKSTYSWFDAFYAWVGAGACTTGGLVDGFIPPANFYGCFEEWIKTSTGTASLGDLALTQDGQIVGSAMHTLVKWTPDFDDQVTVMYDLRAIATAGPGHSFAYDFFFNPTEGTDVFMPESTMSLTLSSLAVIAVVTLMIGDLFTAFFVLLSVLLVLMSILSLLNYTDTYLNSMSMTNMVVSVGVTVDFNAHFAYAFKTSNAKGRNARVIAALDQIAQSIFEGGMSTFLAIAALAFAGSHAFQVFFMCWLGIVLFGVGHALIVLPVLLSLCGPRPYDTAEEDKQTVECELQSSPRLEKSLLA